MSETQSEQGGAAVQETSTETTTEAATEKTQPVEKTFSQAAVNQFLAKQRREILGEAQNIAELKAKAEQLDKLEGERKTELERANETIAKLERQAADATQAAQASRLRAAVVSEAAKRNVVDPDAAMALIDRSSIEFGEDGEPTNIADAMESLLKAKPYLVGGGRNGSADLGARGDGGTKQLSREALQNMTPQEIVEARKAGQLDGLMQGKT